MPKEVLKSKLMTGLFLGFYVNIMAHDNFLLRK